LGLRVSSRVFSNSFSSDSGSLCALAIGSFEEARNSDLQNERLPPTRSQVNEMNATALNDAVERATSERDVKLEAVAKRISM
jgi:hypothetical protein